MTTAARELNLLGIAVAFLTRLPVPQSLDYSGDALNAASRYFALVGVLIGSAMATVYWLAIQLWPESFAVLLALACNLLLTGCFHQDGLADMADGFGGAFERERKLQIMKDSRIGTYGSSALVLNLLAFFVLLQTLENPIPWIIAAQAISRALSVSLITDTPYASDPDKSKAKPLATRMKLPDLVVLAATVIPVLFLLPANTLLPLLLALLVFRWWFRRLLLRQIGGYTGDCLGAGQQLSELLFYALAVVLATNPVVNIVGVPS